MHVYLSDINIITINLKINMHVLPLLSSTKRLAHTIIIPAIMSSTELILSSTCWMRPTSVLVCRFRTLFRRMAVNMLQISAWQVTSQCSNSSTMQPMLSASWIMKFVSRSNSPPTNCRIKWDRCKKRLDFYAFKMH